MSTVTTSRTRSIPLYQQALVAVFRTADALRRALTQVLEPHGLTMQQYNVLRILRGARPDPLPTMDIAERMMDRTPGITRLLDRLEAKGLVRRERCQDDRRQVLCTITPVGLELLAGLDEAVDRADEALLAPLDEREMRELIGYLERIQAQAA
ncbi:MAG: MarR family transcriptional regulator [Candidatus Cloacimonetes bacterium]|jgi:DNA-binding MarR family transcriptional regulator|nr:MarR family transcriptional regulator [Candidatus Cloacimonadota bacterium]